MSISYNKLWKLLIDKGMNKTDLRNATKMSSSTMAKMVKNQPVALSVLTKVCEELKCDIGDIMEVVDDSSHKSEMEQ